MPPPKWEIEELVDSLATISEIIFRRWHCVECNNCEVGGEAFMGALNTLREAGNVAAGVQTRSNNLSELASASYPARMCRPNTRRRHRLM